MQVNIVHPVTREKIKLFEKEQISYAILEISPSKMTSNANVKWLLAEFSRLFSPMHKRIYLADGHIKYSPSIVLWWEVFIHKGQIRFFLTIPDKENLKQSIKRQIIKTWKQANVKEVTEYMKDFHPNTTSISKLSLKHNSVLSLDTQNPHYSSLESLLNAKHYIKDDDAALLQIGMKPLGSGWNEAAVDTYEKVKAGSTVPRKKGKSFTKGDVLRNVLYGVGFIAEELFNLLGDFLIPGWESNKDMSEQLKGRNGDIDSTCTRSKTRADAFDTEIRILASSEDAERRKSIIRSIISGFDPLEGDNKLIEAPVPYKKLHKEIKKTLERKMTVRLNGDVLCALELAKIINVPDQKAQIEHYNELSLVSHRGESEVPKEIFEDDGGIPFATYEDNDGKHKTVYFNAKNKNLLCMPRVIIGEPGTGKTTFAVSNILDTFNAGYGCIGIDAADGKMVQRILDRITPEQRSKVKIIDFTNTDFPIGLGWNEIFRGRNTDIIEDLVVEELLAYIALVSGTELNMRARQWVENAIKATFVTPDATLQDVENMLSNAEFRTAIIPTIEDPELRADWLYFHEKLKPEERKTIYDEAFRRLSPVMRKKALKNFVLQRPKKDAEGNYLFDLRKWMDEGNLVLVKANETLGETLQTALVSFTLSKINLAMVSREDIIDEDDRPPCFVYLDEPDHYIKGSERWRNMLTRFRKYRCGLNFMFHGWQQLKEADKDLPKIIRKAGPHYIIFQTDEDNLLELKSVIEPEFKVQEVAKGMPQFNAVVRLKMYSEKGDVTPAFMARALKRPEERYKKYNNNDLYELCAQELGRPKAEVMDEIYRAKIDSEFDTSSLLISVSTDGDGDLIVLKTEPTAEEKEEQKRYARKIIEYEVSKYIEAQIERGEEPDEDLILEMDDLLEEG